MAEIARLSIVPKGEPAAPVDISKDDYSIKASSPADNIFWIRVELPIRDEIIVSDFNPGKLGDDLLLSAFLKVAGEFPTDVKTFLFKDIAPGPANPRSGLTISAAHSRIEKVAERLAFLRKQKVHRVSLEEYRGKVNVRVQLY